MQRRMKARAQLFRPGGFLAQVLSQHGVVLHVNETLFAHGGVLPHHVEYGLQRMNLELSLWMRGERTESGAAVPMPFIATRGFNSVVWSRLYSREEYDTLDERRKACMLLGAALEAADAKRLIVGHTPQLAGANCECRGKVWRVDVGMSSGMLNAPPQVIEIYRGQVRILGSSVQDKLPEYKQKVQER
eukprot:SM000034S12758  [mRNA]  locus=s34:513672:515094:- [translate_table: standard]